MSQSSPSPASSERVLLAELRHGELSVDELIAIVRHPECGGIATFLGVVRNHDHGEDVKELDYSAHPSAEEKLRDVCVEVTGRHPQARVAVAHRVDRLAVGDAAVVAAASAPHRREAFAACEDLVDTLKRQVPIWKHQVFTDGRDEWVGIA